ncbi:hypothetical protein CLV62_11521 [Dysgonomonas alginatilytica]|uniref:Uncharacterized protein n=1 Tax=Dysgonomonas alginatilytica TaxID=1605892 RepID=A0A2V3PP76_9BACT|nr:hypothetical protein [Dysgonomonas alginatilytica]PXV63139.1 hypothetical protein CLV62_11521 [Dysgonomonas alginatilytica]
MDNLKSAIADKILDLSTSGGDEMRAKLEKINRFRDFADACRSLIQKYPAIESELLRMVENNDFDTKIASSRVDTIIRLSENNTPTNQIHNNIEKDIIELEDIKEHLPTPTTDIQDQIIEQNQPIQEIVSSVQENTEPQKLLPEDIDYEEIAITPEIDKEYADFEEVAPIDNKPVDTFQSEESPVKEIETQSNKETIKKGLLICGIIAVIIALIFIIKFVINNWEIILWIIGGIIVVGIAGIVIKRNRK